MNLKYMLRFTVLTTLILILGIGLAACNRPASTAPATSAPQATVPGGENVSPFIEPQVQTPTAGAPLPPGGDTQPAGGDQPIIVIEVATATPEPQPTATPFPQPTAGRPETYTLQKGEFPYCIARRFNLNPAELLNLNGLGLNAQVYPGQVLKIPQTSNNFVGERALIKHPTTYKVKAGDTIYTIACAFGDVSPETIAAANGLTAPYNLSAGDTLNIP